jgi:hypothetical protein
MIEKQKVLEKYPAAKCVFRNYSNAMYYSIINTDLGRQTGDTKNRAWSFAYKALLKRKT